MMMMLSNVGGVILLLLLVAVLTTTTTTRTFAVAFVPSTASLGRSITSPSSSTLVMAKFQYCSITGTMIAKKAAAAVVVVADDDGVDNNYQSQKNNKIIAQTTSKKKESFDNEEDADEFVEGIGYDIDSCGPLHLVAAAAVAPTWHTVLLGEDDDEPAESPRSSSSIGWDSSSAWYVFLVCSHLRADDDATFLLLCAPLLMTVSDDVNIILLGSTRNYGSVPVVQPR
jgi:hypothetical protein